MADSSTEEGNVVVKSKDDHNNGMSNFQTKSDILSLSNDDKKQSAVANKTWADGWICDVCGEVNGQDDFPCNKCAYPLADLMQPGEEEVFNGYYSEMCAPLTTSEQPHPMATAPSRLHHDSPIRSRISSLPRDLRDNLTAPVSHLDWQCPLCFLVSSEAPCICCGFDPEHEDAQQILEQEEAEKKEHVSLFEQQLQAATKVIEVAHGSQAGAVPLRDGGFRFGVWAPNAIRIFVLGDFNDWQDADPTCELCMEGNFTHWRVDIPKANVGDRYIFKLKYVQRGGSMTSMEDLTPRQRTRASRWISCADPRASVRIMLSCQTNDDHSMFPWTDENFAPPPLNKLVLYEIHVGTFVSHGQEERSGTFLDILQRLDYLVDLGINGIALMPINHDRHPDHTYDKSCWGYGTPDELKLLVDAAHAHGICVVFDAVFNHFDSRSILQFWDGTNLYFTNEPTEWGPRPDFKEPDVQEYIIDGIITFFRDYHMDGVRIDSTSNVRGQGHDIPGGWQLLQRINDVIHDKFPNAFTIAEDLFDDHRLNLGGACFDLQWCQGTFKALFHAAVATTDKARNIREISRHIEHSHPGPVGGRILYTENHDTVPGDREKRIPTAIVHGDMDRVESFYAVMRSTLIASMIFCIPGLPMILQGQEVYESQSPVWPVGPVVDWSRRLRFPGITKRVTNIEGNTLGLTGSYARVHHLNESAGVMGIHRWDRGGAGDDVIVVANFSNKDFRQYRFGFPREGAWTVRLNTAEALYGDGLGGEVQPTTVVNVTPEQPRDGYPFSGAISLRRYSIVFLSQNGITTLVFRIRRNTTFHTHVGVCGSDSALGEWKTPIVLRTETADAKYPWWQSDPITVPAQTHISFKIVTVRDGEIISWEDRENRNVCPPRGRHLLMLS